MHQSNVARRESLLECQSRPAAACAGTNDIAESERHLLYRLSHGQNLALKLFCSTNHNDRTRRQRAGKGYAIQQYAGDADLSAMHHRRCRPYEYPFLQVEHGRLYTGSLPSIVFSAKHSMMWRVLPGYPFSHPGNAPRYWSQRSRFSVLAGVPTDSSAWTKTIRYMLVFDVLDVRHINNLDIECGASSHEDPKRVNAPIDWGTIGANRHIILDIHDPKIVAVFIPIPRSK
ncbi:hypothetical protein ARMSODRAFT_978509 [Armillaria solidipes]|uniref:Uncharacterized protein n=1 Tax=Armillaria solidipes TaxID=1076256 RepID=A0A2H3BMI7_9AGAR|nr:hypothetical protein ARMSODRAFT_978509 [Armillaria solidipes]